MYQRSLEQNGEQITNNSTVMNYKISSQKQDKGARKKKHSDENKSRWKWKVPKEDYIVEGENKRTYEKLKK